MEDSRLIAHLLRLAQFLKCLESQAHIIHLNYIGQPGTFLIVHQYLKERYNAHLEEFDAAAEFIRALGVRFTDTVAELHRQPPGFVDLEPGGGCSQALALYASNLVQVIELAQLLEPLATEARAIDVANWLAELVAANSKAAWFLRATLGS